MQELVTNDHFKAARQINAQLNLTESRNNLPIVNSRPLRLGLDISSVCNIRCIFCLAEGGRKKPSDPDAFRKPDYLDPFEPLFPFLKHAIFSSFEAILNPWLDQFVERLWEYRTPIQLFSNGRDLRPELSEYLLRHGMYLLWCSFHGAEKKTYDSIMKGSDYHTVLSNLMHMKLFSRKHKLDYKLVMVFCAMRRNIEELPRYIDLAHRVGAQEVQVNYLLVTRPGTGLEKEAMCFYPELYDRMVLESKMKAARLGINLMHQRLFSEGLKQAEFGPCYRPWEHLNVNQTGNASICCGGCGSMGNMFEQGFPRLWNSLKLREFRARVNSDDPPTACRNCTRGRENPWDIVRHITYLSSCKGEERRKTVAELLENAPTSVSEFTLRRLAQEQEQEMGAEACLASCSEEN